MGRLPSAPLFSYLSALLVGAAFLRADLPLDQARLHFKPPPRPLAILLLLVIAGLPYRAASQLSWWRGLDDQSRLLEPRRASPTLRALPRPHLYGWPHGLVSSFGSYARY